MQGHHKVKAIPRSYCKCLTSVDKWDVGLSLKDVLFSVQVQNARSGNQVNVDPIGVRRWYHKKLQITFKEGWEAKYHPDAFPSVHVKLGESVAVI